MSAEPSREVVAPASGPAPEPVPARRPPAPRSCAGTLFALAAVSVGVVYILNPGAGVLELIPDNLPGIGNLDEAGAAALLVLGLQHLLGRRR